MKYLAWHSNHWYVISSKDFSENNGIIRCFFNYSIGRFQPNIHEKIFGDRFQFIRDIHETY